MSPLRWIGIILFASLSCCDSSAEVQIPYSEAKFRIPDDPTRALLHITTSAMDGTIRSLTMYSDGRLDLSDNRTGEFERQLERIEVMEVLSGAIEHGLGEWDPLAIRGKQLAKDGAMRRSLDPADGLRVAVLLSVDDYRRGPLEIERLERSISLRSPTEGAERYTEIPQFQGLVELLDWMSRQLALADTMEEQ